MIEKQREKEFLFELERLYYNYNLTIGGDDVGLWLADIGEKHIDPTSVIIERAIDWLKEPR